MPGVASPDPAHVAAALARLRDFEVAHLATDHGLPAFLNPFTRPGVPAADVAWACGLIREGETKSGRQRVDVPAARRLLKHLVAEGLVEPVGFHRTLAAGSATVECYAIKGFRERLDAALARWQASRAA